MRDILTNTEGYNVSERYNVIPTMDVITEFQRFGFDLQDTTMANVANSEKQGYQKHMVRMSTGEKLFGEMRTDVIINNSYDGTKALHIRVGMFRFVCSNGMVVGHNLIPSLQIKHNNNSWQELVAEFIDTYEEKYIVQKEWIANMKDHRLSYDDIEELALKALAARHSDKRIQNDFVDPMEINLAHRKEDRGMYSWETYNRMQENLVNGYYSKYNNEGKIQKAKVMTNVDELIRFNVELSEIFAEQMAAV